MIDFIETLKRSTGMSLLAALLSGAGVLMYATPLAGLFRGAYGDDTFSYIVFIPLVSLYLLYEDRKRIFGVTGGFPDPGGRAVVPGDSSVPCCAEGIGGAVGPPGKFRL